MNEGPESRRCRCCSEQDGEKWGTVRHVIRMMGMDDIVNLQCAKL